MLGGQPLLTKALAAVFAAIRIFQACHQHVEQVPF